MTVFVDSVSTAVELLDRNDKVLTCKAKLNCIEAARSVGTSSSTARAVYAPRTDRSKYALSCVDDDDADADADVECVVVDNRTSKVRWSEKIGDSWKDYLSTTPFTPDSFTTYGVSYLGKDVCVIDQKTSQVMCSDTSSWNNFGTPFYKVTGKTYSLSCSRFPSNSDGVCCVVDQKNI